MTTTPDPSAPRSGTPPQPLVALYVPGDRPERFGKAVTSGADLVIIDLEDAVAPGDKPVARAAVAAWLDEHAADCPVTLEVRVNAGSGDDLELLAAAPPVRVRVPKVESPTDLDVVATALPQAPLSALIETAAGVEDLTAIARHLAALGDAAGWVGVLNLGEADLSSDVGSHQATLDHARVRLLYAARAAGLPRPMMSVYPAIDDLDGLVADTERGRAMGFFGRTVVHPRQIAAVRTAFTPSEREVAWARAVIAAVGDGGVARVDGEMVDPAMVGRAATILGMI